MREAWIIDGVRSPRGRGKDSGALHAIHPQELLAQVLNGLQARVGFDPATIEDVVCGNANGTGDHGAVIGRMAVLAAGWPVATPWPSGALGYDMGDFAERHGWIMLVG